MRSALFARMRRRQWPSSIVCPNGNTRLNHQFDHWAVKICCKSFQFVSYSPPPSPRLVSAVSALSFLQSRQCDFEYGRRFLAMLRAQVMDPHSQISLVNSHPEFQPYYHSPTPPVRRSTRLSISIPQRRVNPLPPTPVPDTRPTYGQFPVNDSSSTRFTRANSDEPMPHQQDPERPPRPPNSWILFRSHMAKERTDLEGRAQSEISAIISKAWKNASADVKLHFEMLAEAKKVEHQARYPHYRFNPIKKADKVRAVKKTKAVNDAIKKVQTARGSRSVSPASKRRVRNDKTRSPSPTKNDPAPSLADQHFATYAPAPAPFFPINDDVPSPHLDYATSLPPSPSLLAQMNLPEVSTSTPIVPPVPMVPSPLLNDIIPIHPTPGLGLFTQEPPPPSTSQWTPEDVTAWLQCVSPVTPPEGQVTVGEPAATEQDHLHHLDGLAQNDLLSPIDLEPFSQVSLKVRQWPWLTPQ